MSQSQPVSTKTLEKNIYKQIQNKSENASLVVGLRAQDTQHRDYFYDLDPDIDVAIGDHMHPKGLLIGNDKYRILKQALFKMMYKDLMSEADISPKFNSSYFDNGVFRLKAVDQHSVEYLIDLIERMPPPWPGAQLYVDYDTASMQIQRHQEQDLGQKNDSTQWQHKKADVNEDQTNERIFVEALVPGKIVVLEEVLYKLKQFDRRIRSDCWQTIGRRPLGNGHVFIFSIDPKDFDVLNIFDGFIPYNDTRIEFRVLKNSDLNPR